MDSTFRYFACGEYGDKTERPHYHLILFGPGLDVEPYVAKSWKDEDTKEPMGFTQVAELNADRAAYIAQYTTKKMTKIGDNRLGHRHPEFARMSMRNGIGFPAIGWLANQMSTKNGMAAMALYGDVWNSVRIDGKIWPLSSYLRRKLRDALGVSQDPEIREEQLQPFIGEIKSIRNEPLPPEYGPWQDLSKVKGLPSRRRLEKKTYFDIDQKTAQARAEKDTRRARSVIKTEKV